MPRQHAALMWQGFPHAQSETGSPQVTSSLEEADLVAGMEDLKLTSKGGRPLTLTPEQLRTMTREQLIGIWKDYVNQLAVLLLELERGDSPSAGDTIKQYIEEVVRSCMRQSDFTGLTYCTNWLQVLVSLRCSRPDLRPSTTCMQLVKLCSADESEQRRDDEC